jgi:hypothetical protein
MKKKIGKRRIVLGVGHPWFRFDPTGLKVIGVNLSKNPTYNVIGDVIPLRRGNLGAWNKCRLVLEKIR